MFEELNAKCSELNAKCSEMAAKCSEMAAKCSEMAAKCSEMAAKCSELPAHKLVNNESIEEFFATDNDSWPEPNKLLEYLNDKMSKSVLSESEKIALHKLYSNSFNDKYNALIKSYILDTTPEIPCQNSVHYSMLNKTHNSMHQISKFNPIDKYEKLVEYYNPSVNNTAQNFDQFLKSEIHSTDEQPINIEYINEMIKNETNRRQNISETKYLLNPSNAPASSNKCAYVIDICNLNVAPDIDTTNMIQENNPTPGDIFAWQNSINSAKQSELIDDHDVSAINELYLRVGTSTSNAGDIKFRTMSTVFN